MELLVLAAVVLTTLTAATIGSMKGRTIEGVFLGLFFSVFGLVAVAAIPPSRAVQRDRDEALARAIAEQMRSDDAACRCCGRGLPGGEPATSGVPASVAESPAAAAAVTVAVAGLEDAVGPACTLTLSVEPGFVLVDACRDSCGDASHALVLTAEEAAEACERLRLADSRGADTRETSGRQNTGLLVDWSRDDTEGTESLSFDWTATFLAPDALARWDVGDRPDEADCGTIYLSGYLATADSEAHRFEAALSEAAHLADEWAKDRANPGYVRATLAAFGSIVEE
jgi:hypothetical protein